MSHVPTVQEVMDECYTSNGWYQWHANGGVSLYNAATLRPALEEAYDPSMTAWPSLVDLDGSESDINDGYDFDE